MIFNNFDYWRHSKININISKEDYKFVEYLFAKYKYVIYLYSNYYTSNLNYIFTTDYEVVPDNHITYMVNRFEIVDQDGERKTWEIHNPNYYNYYNYDHQEYYKKTIFDIICRYIYDIDFPIYDRDQIYNKIEKTSADDCFSIINNYERSRPKPPVIHICKNFWELIQRIHYYSPLGSFVFYYDIRSLSVGLLHVEKHLAYLIKIVDICKDLDPLRNDRYGKIILKALGLEKKLEIPTNSYNRKKVENF